jgi:hypothetical protein
MNSTSFGELYMIAVRFFLLAHGKGRNVPFSPGAVSCFFLPCVMKKRTAKILYRVLSDAAHGKGILPCKMLPCALCRAPRRKTHGKEFAVRFWTFRAPAAHGKPTVSRSATAAQRNHAPVEWWFPLAAPPPRAGSIVPPLERPGVTSEASRHADLEQGSGTAAAGHQGGDLKAAELEAALVEEGQRWPWRPGRMVEDAPSNLALPGGGSEEGSADRRRREELEGLCG